MVACGVRFFLECNVQRQILGEKFGQVFKREPELEKGRGLLIYSGKGQWEPGSLSR